MNLVFGVGNEQDGDDGVGPYIAKNLKQEGWKGINCSVSPEDYTSVARQESPDLLLVVDAADMGLPPGSMRTIPKEKVSELAISTHYVPLSVLIKYLETLAKKVVFIGIQPKQKDNGLSEPVKKAAEKLLQKIKENDVSSIKPITP